MKYLKQLTGKVACSWRHQEHLFQGVLSCCGQSPCFLDFWSSFGENMNRDPLICSMTPMPHFVTGREAVLPIRLPLALVVSLCRLEKCSPSFRWMQLMPGHLTQWSESGLDFGAHSLGQMLLCRVEGRPQLSEYRLPLWGDSICFAKKSPWRLFPHDLLTVVQMHSHR